MGTILQDKFVGANGTALADHVPIVGGPWSSPGPGLVIQSNKLTGSDAAAASSAPMLTKTCRARLTFDMNAADGGSLFIVEMTDTAVDNYAVFQLKADSNFSVDVATPDDPFVSVAGELPPIAAGPHLLDMQINASRLRVAIDGILVVECPRTILLANALTLFNLKLNVAAGLYPKFSDLLVTN